MYRPPPKRVRPPREAADDPSATPAPSIYSHPRTIHSLGLTLGLEEGTSATSARLRATLQRYEDSDGDDEDQERAAAADSAALSCRTMSRLARHKPWRSSSGSSDAIALALQQHQQHQAATRTSTQRPSSAAPSARRSSHSSLATTAPLSGSLTTRAAAHVVAATSRPATAAAHRPRAGDVDAAATPVATSAPPRAPRPSTAAPRSNRLSALEASIRTLQSSTYRPQSDHPAAPWLNVSPLPLPLSLATASESATAPRAQTARPASGNRSRPTATATVTAVRTQQGYAMPTAASAHHQLARGGSNPSRPSTATHTSRRDSSTTQYGASAASYASAGVSSGDPIHPVQPTLPCVVRSFLRLTHAGAAPSGRASLAQHKDLPFVLHDRCTVQFVEEADLPLSGRSFAVAAAAAIAAAAATTGSPRPAPVHRYQASLPVPPTPPPLFTFERVFGPAPAVRSHAGTIAAASQAEDLFASLRPLFSCCLGPGLGGESAPEEEGGPLAPMVVLAIGALQSGKSATLFGMSGPSPPSSSVAPGDMSGLVERFLHHVYALASGLPRGSSATIGVSVLLLLQQTDETHARGDGRGDGRGAGDGSRTGSSACIDLLRAEMFSVRSASASDLWHPSPLSFDPGTHSCGGMVVRDCASASEAHMVASQARRRWVDLDPLHQREIAAAAGARPASFVVSVHLVRRDKAAPSGQQAAMMGASATRSNHASTLVRCNTVRFIEVAACLREWGLARAEMLTTSTSNSGSGSISAMQHSLADLHDIDALLRLRAQADLAVAGGHAPQRLACAPRSSPLSKMLLPALNGGVLALLSHLSTRGGAGAGAVGSQLARQIFQHFGALRTPSHASVGVGDLSSPLPLSSASSTSLVCTRHPYPSFLVERVYPAVQSALPRFYDPLLDIVMEYVGAPPNLSARVRRAQKEREAAMASAPR